MQGPQLEVEYADADAFRRDYESDLVNGGVFVDTEQPVELRSSVVVRLQLRWCDQSVDLPGEVVHVVTPEMEAVGGKAGVAIQFLASASELRDRLSELGLAPESAEPEVGRETRRAPRRLARVYARISFGDRSIEGKTRDLSRSGVLVCVEDAEISIGETVVVTLRHPTSDEELEVEGRVVREIAGEDGASAIALQFDPQLSNRLVLERFVDDVQSLEHTRRLGGISGPISELGPQSILHMFASTAPLGTIIFRNHEEEGMICFEGGLMRAARLGAASGMKALVRMLTWTAGTFEFHARLEESATKEAPFPLDAAIFDAVRQIDESERIDAASFPLQARLVRCAQAAPDATDALTKVECALLDLAAAGFTVQRALEVIPEPDLEIFLALRSLIDESLLELH